MLMPSISLGRLLMRSKLTGGPCESGSTYLRLLASISAGDDTLNHTVSSPKGKSVEALTGRAAGERGVD
jgi:hypothetical protein